MRKVIVGLTIILAILAAIAVMPSFTAKAFGKSVTWPEIDYSKILKTPEPVELSYKKGKEFDKYTSVVFQVTTKADTDQKAATINITEIMKQRLEVMEVVEPEVRYYQSGDHYFIQVDLPGTKEETQSFVESLKESGNIEFWKSIPQTDANNDGEPDPAPSYSDNPFLSGFQPTEINSAAFESAKLNVNSTYGGYTVRVFVKKDAFLDQTELVSLSDNTWVAVASEYPIGAGRQISVSPNVIFEFIPQLGKGTKTDALSLLSVLGTKPYPADVPVSSQNEMSPQASQNSLILFAVAGLVSFMIILIVTYWRAKEALIFMKVTLFSFAVFTLFLFKVPSFNIRITFSLLLSFLIIFIATAIFLYYMVEKLATTINEVHPKNKLRLIKDFYKPFKKQMNFILIFFLFFLTVLNLMHPGLYRQFINGFGFGVVVLFIMIHTVIQPLLKTFYGMPLNINLNGAIKKISKK